MSPSLGKAARRAGTGAWHGARRTPSEEPSDNVVVVGVCIGMRVCQSVETLGGAIHISSASPEPMFGSDMARCGLAKDRVVRKRVVMYCQPRWKL